MITRPENARLRRAFAILLIAAGPAAGAALPVDKPPATPLVVSAARALAPEGARNPTVAFDRRSGAVSRSGWRVRTMVAVLSVRRWW